MSVLCDILCATQAGLKRTIWKWESFCCGPHLTECHIPVTLFHNGLEVEELGTFLHLWRSRRTVASSNINKPAFKWLCVNGYSIAQQSPTTGPQTGTGTSTNIHIWTVGPYVAPELKLVWHPWFYCKSIHLCMHVKTYSRTKCFVLTRTLNQLLDSSRVSSAVVNMTVVWLKHRAVTLPWCHSQWRWVLIEDFTDSAHWWCIFSFSNENKICQRKTHCSRSKITLANE